MKKLASGLGFACVFTIFATSGPVVSATDAGSQRILDVETMRREVVGKKLVNPSINVRVVIQPDGTLSGTLRNDDLAGHWDFRNGYFCRSYRTRSEASPVDCQTISLDDEGITLVYHRGRGHRERYQFAD